LSGFWWFCFLVHAHQTQTQKLEEETMIHLVAIYLFVATLVNVCQILYLGWRIWPFLRRADHALRSWLHRKMYCPWCWDELHLKYRFPARWSSTICRHHERRIRTQLAARRRARETTRQRAVCMDKVQ
jgi:hypothetical protein